MAGRIRQSDIDEVKSRTNIADIVGDHVSLKSAGVGSMKGLCPFHDERSPSFHVRPQVGFYHCFGCGESGDAISFLRKIDHVTFTEAVERLAGRIGFTLHYEDGGRADEDGPNRARLLAANTAAEQWFQEQLHTAAADPGRRFLGERGFDAAAAARFGVGFAPQSWDQLTKMLQGRGFTREEILASGLVSQGDRGAYDRFRGRLIWPIRDVTGQTVGFGARRLLDDDKGPKYLNTPETPVYHKAQVLYGLDLAKREISRGHRVVVVEGYTDVMAAHLAGVGTAVATCGTSFGVDHIKVLRRIMGDDSSGGEVIFTFDPDAAGQKAALRAFSEEKRFSAQTYVAIGRDGLDPCDLRLAHGDGAVRGLIDSKEPMFEFVIRQVLADFDLDTVEGRVAALRKAAPIVADIRDPSLRPGYARVLAGRLGVELDEVTRAVNAASRRSSGPTLQDPVSVVPVVERAASLRDLPSDPATRLERDALMAIVQHPDLVGRELVESAIHTRIDNPTLALVRDALAASMDLFGTPEWFLRVAESLPEPYRPFVRQLAVAPIPQRDGDRFAGYVRGITTSLVERDLLQREAELRRMIQRSDPTDRDASRDLQRRLVALGDERRRLQSGVA
ncbi:DNA primase [Labedella gwakjiensis]|uniref:DNA primase n=1 Tax=Labedella gwakjiensis TaxID=390269 RepID=A0A2P8H085_9MICO|nr:DNA primase [Labedella gwakjiensis]PSL39609.1 DNA primase [Labedella gwakjiensis]RUQ86000.1 DNA primase [Labedella gwakjiensis]